MKAVFLPAQRAFLRYVEIPGTDPPLLWLHGWQCTSTGELLETAVQPALAGRRSLLVDFLGHGYSDRPSSFTYSLDDHAATIVALIDALGLADCGVVGHSMGGSVAIRVAAARPDVVSLLVLAEGGPEITTPAPDYAGMLGGQSESDFVATGYPQPLVDLADSGVADPTSVPAVHIGITRLVDPRAIQREAASMDQDDERAQADALVSLRIPRWYLHGELSDPEPDYEKFLDAAGVGFRIVPGVGHPMGLQNASGFAATVADVVTQSWPGQRHELVRTLVEECWTTAGGLERMAKLIAPGYVHHTPFGDGGFDDFSAGLRYVDGVFADRRYSVVHLVDDGELVAAYLTWTATRVTDGSAVVGSGAYHCRIVDGVVAEDWDAFFPSA